MGPGLSSLGATGASGRRDTPLPNAVTMEDLLLLPRSGSRVYIRRGVPGGVPPLPRGLGDPQVC